MNFRDYIASICNTHISAVPLKNGFKGGTMVNSNFETLKDWVKCYLGACTFEVYDKLGVLENLGEIKQFSALKDENRNAIIPELSVTLDTREYFLSIKGCGAYNEIFNEKPLDHASLRKACRNSDERFIKILDDVVHTDGFIMSESWMNESPYGGHGEENAQREFSISRLTDDKCGLSICGAYICPSIAAVRFPVEFETISRNFYWFRQFAYPFYQTLRLVPSNVRLYFESDHLVSDHGTMSLLFGIDSSEKAEKFILNFIKSGCALLSLFSRTSQKQKKSKEFTGIIYQDVWFDKDCVVASDGIIHFADLEGLMWKTVSVQKYEKEVKDEWHKLIFEFLSALVHVDNYRRSLLSSKKIEWEEQRKDLAELVYIALQDDMYCYPKYQNNNLEIILIHPKREYKDIVIPFFENVKIR